MKISRLSIKDYHQFKTLDIDLTYPEGHAKAGQPLDKVCFIGQSGTGKTTLLKLLFECTMSKNGQYPPYKLELDHKLFITHNLHGYETLSTMSGHVHKKLNGKLVSADDLGFGEELNQFINSPHPFLLFFPAELKYQNFNLPQIAEGSTRKIYDFSDDDIQLIWNKILNEIQIHQEKVLSINHDITKIVSNGNKDSEALQQSINELKSLTSSEYSPIKQLAEKCLDPVLKKFKLKVNTDLDIKTKDDLGKIKIVDNHGSEIPFESLSTGTKQVFFSALPLYTVKPANAIIFYDEPERSLYPDLQKMIVEYYTSFTKNSQFFFATHSPIIASSFEPWEIVELKFNDEGYVVQELYYPVNEERHVDNYTIIPQYLTYDSMLHRVFDVKAPNNELRNIKITELLTLKAQLEKLKGKNDTHFNDLYNQYEDLAEKLSWDFKS